MHRAMVYESTPGATGQAVATTSANHWKLVMVAHPDCPCTSASLQGLASAAPKLPKGAEVTVVFVGDRPTEPTKNMHLASGILGAKSEWRTAKVAEQRYGARTSGTLVIYRPDGKVAYDGGITPGRGVLANDFAWRQIDRVITGKPTLETSPVYGCALSSEETK